MSTAYIFHQQQLLVDQNFQLPEVERLSDDLDLNTGHDVIARDLSPHDVIPEGFQLVPIRQLLTLWNKKQFEDMQVHHP